MIKIYSTLLFVFVFIIGVYSQIGDYPPAGMYVGLSSTFLNSIGAEITQKVNAQLNAYPIPDSSGDDDKIKYDITSVKQNVALSQFFFNQYDSTTYVVGFENAQFTIKANYKVCKHVGDQDVDLCEHGDLTIASQVSGIKIFATITLDFNQGTPTLHAVDVAISTPNANAISYSAHCQSRVCDHTHEISDKVSSQFEPAVETGALTQLNEAFIKLIPLIPVLENLNFAYAGNDFEMDVHGSLVESQTDKSSLTPTMTLALNGGVVVKKSNGDLVYPTKQPTFIPPTQYIEDLTSQVSVTITPYLFETLLDGVLNSALPMTIDKAPASSPVQLNTNDPFFSQTAPGLTTKYPNKPITVYLHNPLTEQVIINQTGITFVNTSLIAEFEVDNTQVFSIQFSFNVDLDASFKQVGQAVNVTTSIKGIEANAFVQESSVGSVDTSGFIQLIQLLQTVISIPPMAIKNPSTTYSLSFVKDTFYNGLVQLDFNIDNVFNTQNNKILIK